MEGDAVSYRDEEQVIHRVDDLSEYTEQYEYEYETSNGCLVYLIVGLILVAGGSIVVLGIIGITTLVAAIVGLFS